MRRLTFASFLWLGALLAPGSSSAGWTVQPTPTSADLHVVDRHGNSVILVGGDNGTILKTLDRGVTFTVPLSGSNASLRSLVAPTSVQYYAGGSNGTVLYSTDQGDSWTSVGPGGAARVDIFTRSSGWLWAAGTDGSLRRGSSFGNGGNWTAYPSGTLNALNSGSGFSHSLAYVVGDNGTILKTVNGTDWFAKPSGTSEHLYDYIDAANGSSVIVGANGTVLRSTDSGESWMQIQSGTNEHLYSVASGAGSSFLLMAVGARGTTLYSSDAGLTWCRKSTGIVKDLFGVEGIGAFGYLAVGEDGIFLATDDRGGDCVTATPVEAPRVGKLSFVAPNPLRHRGQVRLEVTRDQDVEVSLYDIAGRKVGPTTRHRARAGQSTPLAVGSQSLAAGTYFVVVEGETFREERKFSVVR